MELILFNDRTGFEALPNELMFDIFQYMSTFDLFHGFSMLNIRFTVLLRQYVQGHMVNLQAISKTNLDYMYRYYLPSLLDQVTSLCLSDDESTPTGVDYFLSYGFNLQQFHRLGSLTLHRLRWPSTIFDQLEQIPQLTKLCITRYDLSDDSSYSQRILQLISRLPNLVYCHVDLNLFNDLIPSIEPTILIYLKKLHLPNLFCSIRQIVRLIKSMPNLNSLRLTIDDDGTSSIENSAIFPSIKRLELSFRGSWTPLKSLFALLPNLETLKIDMNSIMIPNGEWEQMIEHYFRYLSTFQWKVYRYFRDWDNIEERTDQLLLPFTTPFWIEHHRWYVQCDWSVCDQLYLVHVYTLPYAFENIFHFGPFQSKSTCPYSNHCWSFDRIRHIYATDSTLDHLSLFSKNIRTLEITVDDNHSDDSMEYSMDRLESLRLCVECQFDAGFLYEKVASVLKRLPRLRSLTLFSWIRDFLFLLRIEHPSIRRVDISGPENRRFNQEECEIIGHSALLRLCEILHIRVEKRQSILTLIDSMSNLNVLHVQCADDEKLNEWLQEYLPSNDVIITNSMRGVKWIQLWLR